ncbi:MAG: histidinol-phosphate aminotransferase [Myxococcaceae bacterium]|nr:histidinol-phosphate aminotransferase [Myxococcaceae bacterium]
MNRYWSPFVERLSPYVPGEQPSDPDLVKLNTNENPYGPSPRVISAVRTELGERLRLYPNPESDPLRDAIARLHGVSREHVFVGNGSDEVLAHAFFGLFKQPLPLLFPDVTYSFYPTYCQLYEIAFETVSVNDRFEIEPAGFLKPHGGIVFANPNAPTGIPLPLAQVEQLVQASDRVVLVDEAYVDFGGESAIPLVERYDNLLVVQTFSKSRSLAGMRIGFAVGQPHLIEALSRVKNSFNSYPIDRLAMVAGVAAIEDEEWFEDTRQRVIDSRTTLAAALRARGFTVLPSATNFLFARHDSHSAEQLARGLRERGVLVRYFNKPRIEQFLRITIGRPDQCEALLSALNEIV